MKVMTKTREKRRVGGALLDMMENIMFCFCFLLPNFNSIVSGDSSCLCDTAYD